MIFLLCVLFLFEYTSGYYWLGYSDQPASNEGYDYQSTIQRPCSIKDLNCIRRFLAHNTPCAPAHGTAPDPYDLQRLPLELPHANMTVVLDDAKIGGLGSGIIKEFYFNKKTDTLVLEVEFDYIKVDTPNTVGVYYFRGREPVEIPYATVLVFRHVSLTLTIRNFRDANNARAHIYAYFNEPEPSSSINPKAEEPKDPELMEMKKQWLEGMSLSAREAYLAQGPVYLSVFLNSEICDFGHVLGN